MNAFCSVYLAILRACNGLKAHTVSSEILIILYAHDGIVEFLDNDDPDHLS